jgi:hypothetical protein
MIERYHLDKQEYPAIVNKIKIQSNLDISEKRLPQDGRIFFQLDATQFDIRVSVLPTLHGEKIVLRLLSNDATDIDLEKLGFSEIDFKNYLDLNICIQGKNDLVEKLKCYINDIKKSGGSKTELAKAQNDAAKIRSQWKESKKSLNSVQKNKMSWGKKEYE